MKIEKTQYDVIERVDVPWHEINNPLVQELIIGDPVEVGNISVTGRISHGYSCKMKALVKDGVKYKLVFNMVYFQAGLKYKTRNGMVATVDRLETDLEGKYPIKGRCDGQEMSWTWDGKQLRGGGKYPFDLIREVVENGK